MSIRIHLDTQKCHPFLNGKGCARCLEVCSLGVFLSGPQPMPTKPGVPIDHYRIFVAQPRLCTGCRKCEQACQAAAIRISS